MEFKIIKFVVKGTAQVIVPPEWQEYVQVGNRGVAVSRVFYVKLSAIHLTKKNVHAMIC